MLIFDCQAKEFSRSAVARDSDFTTNLQERGTFYMPPSTSSSKAVEFDDSIERRATATPRGRKVRGALVIQFAANDGVQLADAAELVKPWVDGIDLNCGTPFRLSYCPQPR